MVRGGARRASRSGCVPIQGSGRPGRGPRTGPGARPASGSSSTTSPSPASSQDTCAGASSGPCRTRTRSRSEPDGAPPPIQCRSSKRQRFAGRPAPRRTRTRFARGSLPATNQGPPDRPRPRRWPIVNNQCPRWVPTSSPVASSHDRPRPLAEVGGDEVAVPDAPEEADALAVPAVLRREPEPGGEPPDLGLQKVPDRKQRAVELARADPGEEVGLVLHRVGGAVQLDAVRRLDPPRVVSGRHPLEAAAGDLGVHPVR